jgi:hypothetical protein
MQDYLHVVSEYKIHKTNKDLGTGFKELFFVDNLYLVADMEREGLQFYSPMVGELFADYVSNPQIRAKPTRYAGCLSLVKWLDDIIENCPHLMSCRQMKKHPLMGESRDIYVQLFHPNLPQNAKNIRLIFSLMMKWKEYSIHATGLG